MVMPLLLFPPIFMFTCKYTHTDKLLIIYTACSLVIGLLFIGGNGVVHNALFDVLIALILVACSVLLYLGQRLEKHKYGYLVGVILLVYILYPVISFSSNHRTIRKLSQLHYLPVLEEITANNISIVNKYDDPVACENLALCYWAGKSFLLDYFNTGQRIRLNDQGQRRILLDMIARKQINLVHTEKPGNPEKRLPEEIIDALYQNYELLDENFYGHLYIPK